MIALPSTLNPHSALSARAGTGGPKENKKIQLGSGRGRQLHQALDEKGPKRSSMNSKVVVERPGYCEGKLVWDWKAEDAPQRTNVGG